MKKTLNIFLATVMLLSMSTTAFASETQGAILTYTTEGITVEQQISPDVVNDLPESMLKEIQNVGGTLVSVSTSYYDLDSGTETRAVMPTSDFKLTVTASRLSDETMEADEVEGDGFIFIATGEWLVNPLFEFTDCIGITWSDEFTLYDDYGYAYTANYMGTGVPLYDFDALTLNDVSAEQGFAYDANLLLFERQNEITIVGKVYKDDSSGSANVCASYGHVIITASSIDVSFSSGKEIGMSVGITSGIEMASPDYDYFNY